jgi:tetratricopeptide (TPR) repeat protein
LQLNSEYPEAYYNLGAALLIQGQTENAIAQLSNALQFRKNYAEAFYTLGVAQVRAGKKQDAIQSFIQAQAYFNQQKNTAWAQQSDRQIQRLRSS